ncbi:MAG: Mut7-C RNAse domain-containing protein [Anaerolineae bacterium]
MTQPIHRATFRFYAELNDFLPAEQRQRTIGYTFHGKPAVKDAIEALGVPHTEVEIVLVNMTSVDFSYQLKNGDRVAVYPVFESLDIAPLIKVRDRPLRTTRFILDVHLGKLARLLRLLGFDAIYSNDYEDPEIVRISQEERRIILTRDVGLLKRGAVTHGYWLRSTAPVSQAREVVSRFDLQSQVRPFTRCLRCNGLLKPVDKATILDKIPPHVAEDREAFSKCTSCGQIYWRGTHFERLEAVVDKILDTQSPS